MMPSLKEKTELLWLVVFGYLLMNVVAGNAQNERLRLINADALKQETHGNRVQQSLEGHVEFRQGKTTILCDRATQTLDKEPVALIGNVRIIDDQKELRADTVYFYQDSGKQIARGHVISISDTDSTYCDQMTYFQKTNKIVSEGDVKIVNPKDNTSLVGGYAEYWRNESLGILWNDPIWFKYDSLGTELLRTTGDTMEVFEDHKRILVRNNVTISQPKTAASCNRLEYFKAEERALLTEDPKVTQSNQRISGDTLILYFEDGRVNRASVLGNAQALSEADSTNLGKWVNRLSGQRMDFYFKAGELQRVIIEQQATSEHHLLENGEYKGKNEVSGDEIEVLMTDGTARQVKVVSSPDLSSGRYVPPKK